MENRHLNFVNENLIWWQDVMTMSEIEVYDKFNINSDFCFDTESCKDQKQMLIKGKERERVYSWAISNTANDLVIYGYNLYDSFVVFQRILACNFKYEEKYTMRCFVHNLAWDVEFMKYTLFEHGYSYHIDDVDEKTLKLKRTHINEYSYNICENENTVYACDVYFDSFSYKKGNNKKKKTVNYSIKFIDSYKIMPKSLDSIAKSILTVDPMFLKLSEAYNYEMIRYYNYTLSDIEKRYLYNDVYLLKEFIKQFYFTLSTEQLTASSIAFESMLRNKYGASDKENYKLFEEHFPLIKNPMVKEIIDDSYIGGFTQANHRFVGKTILLPAKGVSVDINSSYPNQMRNTKLPYGQPFIVMGDYDCEENDKIAIKTILFDGFKPVHSLDEIGHIKCGAINTEIFGRTGNEYLYTNFIEGKISGYGNMKDENYLYKLSLWNFELEQLQKIVKFYSFDKSYDDITELWYNDDTYHEGFEIESSVVFDYEIGYFKDFVDECMQGKTLGKVTKNKILTESSKLKANSVTGKMASRQERTFRDLTLNDEGFATFVNTGKEYEATKKYFKAFTSAITAWGRVQLREAMYTIGYYNILYFDTDSLYTTQTAEYIRSCGLKTHSTDLGAWDVEKEYTKFKAIGAKKYILYGRDYCKPVRKTIGKINILKGIKYKLEGNVYRNINKMHVICKCAGLPKEVREKVDFEGFYLGATFHDKKMKTKVLGGYRIVKGDYKLSDNARSY